MAKARSQKVLPATGLSAACPACASRHSDSAASISAGSWPAASSWLRIASFVYFSLLARMYSAMFGSTNLLQSVQCLTGEPEAAQPAAHHHRTEGDRQG